MAIPTKLPAGVKTWNPTKLKAFIDTYGEPENVDPSALENYQVVENGHESRTDNTFAWDDGTLTLTVAPTGDDYIVHTGGVKFTLTGDTVTITDTEGLWFFYIDLAGDLVATQTFSDAIITDYAFVCLMYWDATNKVALTLAEERHGYQMNSVTHLYNHHTIGTRFESGAVVGDMDSEGSGNNATAAQFSVSSAIIWDEDVEITLPVQTAPANCPIFYKEGAGGTTWRKLAATDYLVSSTGSGRAAYNNEDAGGAGVWGISEVDSNDFTMSHLFATNDVNTPYIIFMGQSVYNTVNEARAAASSELLNLKVAGMPTVEYKSIATFILQTNDGYSNAVKSRVRDDSDGNAYVDWRYVDLGVTVNVAGAAATALTPWTENIDAGGYALTSAVDLVISTTADDSDIHLQPDGLGIVKITNITSRPQLELYDADASYGVGDHWYMQAVDGSNGMHMNFGKTDASDSGGNIILMRSGVNAFDQTWMYGYWEWSAGSHDGYVERDITGLGQMGYIRLGSTNKPNISFDGKTIQAENNAAASPLNINIYGGDVKMGNFDFDADQTVGAGQDDYVLTYDNASGKIGLEAGGGGGGSQTPWTADVDADGFSLITADSSSVHSKDLTIQTGDFTGTAGYRNAGDITIKAGDHTGNEYYSRAGGITIEAGAQTGTGDYGYGGDIDIKGGPGAYSPGTVRIKGSLQTGTSKNGGAVQISGGDNTTSPRTGGGLLLTGGQGFNAGGQALFEGGRTIQSAQQGGNAVIKGGQGDAGHGGDVVITGGVGHTSYSGGDIIISTGQNDTISGSISLTTGASGGTRGRLSLEGQKFPIAAGTAGWVLKTDGTDCYWAAA